MNGHCLKSADREVTCVMDWLRGELAAGEKVVADLGWSVEPGLNDAGDLAVARPRHDLFRSWAALVGGVEGRGYVVSNRVRTSDGRVLSRAVVLRIGVGHGPH